MAKYNPYNSYKAILDAKAGYHNAKEFNEDPNKWHEQALPHYQDLYDNGYIDLANALQKSDYIRSRGLMEEYGLKPDNQFNLDTDYNEMMSGNIIPASEAVAPKSSSGVPKNSELIAPTASYDPSVMNVFLGKANSEPSPYVNQLIDQFNAGDNRLNGEIKYDANGNVVSGLNTEHYNIGRNQLDYINNFDVTKQPYYQGIMDQYKLGGANAADNEYAQRAANNGGNIDSYAAANANRQQLAFTTAGQEAALKAAQQNAQNWQTLYSQMSADLKNQGDVNVDTLKVAADLYSTDAQERMNAMDNVGALEKQRMANEINAFLAAVNERMADKQISANQALNEADIAAEKERLEMSLASQERINTQNAETARIQSANSLAGTQYAADRNLEGTRYSSDANLTKAQIDAKNKLDVANLESENSRKLLEYQNQSSGAIPEGSKLDADMKSNIRSMIDKAWKKYNDDRDVFWATMKYLDTYYGSSVSAQYEEYVENLCDTMKKLGKSSNSSLPWELFMGNMATNQ